VVNKALFWSFYVSFCVFCAFLWLKNPRNLRNPCLIKDLRACKALYTCRDTFTDVMSALQIKLFMQNKAKFRKVKLNVNNVLTKDYEQKDTWSSGKKQSQTNPNEPKTNPKRTQRTQNEPKTNPIQSQSKPICRMLKMNVNKVLSEDYEKCQIGQFMKTKPIQSQFIAA
jgi:hypothetical protein